MESWRFYSSYYTTITLIKVTSVLKIELNFGLHLIFILANLPAVCNDLFAERRNPDSPYGQKTSSLAFIHTFETAEQCAMVCPKPCVDQILEELEMMQRWICDPSMVFS